MATIINATTGSAGGVVITPDTSGNLQLQWNGIPAPTFNAYQSSAQATGTSTWTLIQFQSKAFLNGSSGTVWDSASAFNNTGSTVTLNGISVPAYSYAPPVAGYYQVSYGFSTTITTSFMGVQLYKNGSSYASGAWSGSASAGGAYGSNLVYLNGTSDYINVYLYAGSNQTVVNTQNTTYFQGCLVRGA